MGLAIITHRTPRVRKPGASPAAAKPAQQQEASVAVPDGFLDKLVKLIPAEVVAFYIGVVALLGDQPKPETKIVALVVGLVLTGLVLRVPTVLSDGTKVKAPWQQYVLRGLGFLLWATALNQPLASLVVIDPQIVAILIMGFTFASPFLVPSGTPA